MVDLQPIVIPALEHTYKSNKYTCLGQGLLKDDYSYDAHAEKLIPPKVKAGVAQPDLAKKPVAFWKAQCAFRGLNQSGNINDLQQRLKLAKAKMLPELKIVETELNKEFKKKNKAARDDSWSSLKSVEQKAKSNPKKFLAETFPNGGTGRPANLDIVVLKLSDADRIAVDSAADSMGLQTAMADAPWTSSRKPSPNRWIIIGRTRDAVWNQMKDIERDTARSKLEFTNDKSKATPLKKSSGLPPAPAPKVKPHDKTLPAKSTTIRKAPPAQKPPAKQPAPKFDTSKDPAIRQPTPKLSTTEQPDRSSYPARYPLEVSDTEGAQLSRPGGRTKQTARKTSSYSAPRGDSRAASSKSAASIASDGSWDVRGIYQIECPAIEEQWGSGDSMPTLVIYFEIQNGKPQLFAMFDFQVVKGIMRFEKPIPVSKSAIKSEDTQKRKWDDMDDDGDVNMDLYPDYNDDRGSKQYTEKVFFLGTKDKPTARRPTWRYRWRGTETGEGEIQLGSDEVVQSITFSDKGDTVSGTFRCNFAGECHFTGQKVATHASNGHVSPEEEWERHSEAAHEYARRARWGGFSRW